MSEDDIIRPLIVSSTIILKGESSEEQAQAIVDMIKRGAKRLERWANKVELIYPDYKHDIPSPNKINIQNKFWRCRYIRHM